MNCIATQSCQGVAAIFLENDRYQFDMQAISSELQKPAYIALGLSDDDRMGGDSVIECVPENDKINAYTSYTTAPTPFSSRRDGIPQTIIRLVDSSYINGTIRCRIERQTISVVRGRRFDLANDQYYLLLALGEKLKKEENSVGYHSIGRISTEEKTRLPVIIIIEIVILSFSFIL